MSETVTEVTPADIAPATTPEAEPAQAVNWEEKFIKAQAEARKWEDTNRANKHATEKLAAIEEASKSEAQKLTDRVTAAESLAAGKDAELARFKAALKHGLSEDDLEILGSHGTADEIAARAERLAKRLKAVDAVKAKSKDFGGGDRGTDVTGKAGQLSQADMKKMSPAAIDKAFNEGRFNDLLNPN